MSEYSGIKIVLYKKIVPGDIRKFFAESNDTASGGGARDLRLSPADKFFPILKRLFPKAGIGNTFTGELYWENEKNTKVTIHSPTNSRPNEVRIAKIHECFPKSKIPSDANDCILLFVQDEEGKVWPYFISEYSLKHDDWHEVVKKGILRGLNAKRSSSVSAAGFIDFESNTEYTNGI